MWLLFLTSLSLAKIVQGDVAVQDTFVYIFNTMSNVSALNLYKDSK